MPTPIFPATNSIQPAEVAATTNAPAATPTNVAAHLNPFVQELETARYLRRTRETAKARMLLISLLGQDSPVPVQKSALLELGALAQDDDDQARAQDIYSQFLNRWPDDPRVPEVLLRQGRIFRQMGLHELALTKFYAVMTTALTLKNDRLAYYEKLVAEAQMEIAETHYELGKYADAAGFFSRLYKQDNPAMDRAMILYRMVRCYSCVSNYERTVACGNDFLAHYPDASEEPEVRFYLASALRALGRNNESLEQVLTLLREQSTRAKRNPAAWAYWRQRAGNLIANAFYREGDYPRALDIYNSLAKLDTTPQWQLPVWYQIGLTYEHLSQPQQAVTTYDRIIQRQQQLGTNSPPDLKSIADMARWRLGFIHWQGKAEIANRNLSDTNAAFPAPMANPVANRE